MTQKWPKIKVADIAENARWSNVSPKICYFGIGDRPLADKSPVAHENFVGIPVSDGI